jgi:Na+-transporting methylmalonyl-CoA/oxaloacetate decarboxylase gamma subunit
MEGFGFAKAASNQGRGTSNILVGVVRGISDIIGQPQTEEEKKKEDEKKEKEEADNTKKKIKETRPKKTKELASATASAFTFWLLYKLYG